MSHRPCPAPRRVALLVALIATAAVACDDESKKRPIGATCTEDEECQDGVCGGGLCLDPALDTDLDGLINRVEAGLDTDPVAPDTDGDGIPDGLEVGADPSRPLDTDGDGRLDARESATADCDRDQRPDQIDAEDGLDPDGTCPGSVVISPCQDLCARAQSMQCPGASVGCLTSCSEVFTEAIDDCRAKFAAAGSCVAAAEGVSCAGDERPAWQLDTPEGVCVAEIQAVSPCLEGEGGACLPHTLIATDTPIAGTLPSQTSLLAYGARPQAGVAYEVIVTPTGALDDPSVALFASTEARCAWLLNPTGSLPAAVSDEVAGAVERIPFTADARAPGTIDVLVVNAREDGPTSFTIEVRAARDP